MKKILSILLELFNKIFEGYIPENDNIYYIYFTLCIIVSNSSLMAVVSTNKERLKEFGNHHK